MSRTFKPDRIRDTDLPNVWVFTTAQVECVRLHQLTKEHAMGGCILRRCCLLSRK